MSVDLLHVLGWASAIFVIVLLFIGLSARETENNDRSLDYHRSEGGYRVLYDDGQLSQPFLHQTAKDYAEMFGGQVVSRNFKRPNETASQG